MAFSDYDVHSHLRSIGLSRGKMIASYDRVGIPDPDHKGEGKTPHMADLRAKNQAILTLAGTANRGDGSLMKPLHWARISEVEK